MQRSQWVAATVVATILFSGCREQPRSRPPTTSDGPPVLAAIPADASPPPPPPPDAAPPPPDATPPAPDAAPIPASACANAKTMRTYDEGDAGKKITLKVTQTFAVELSAARHRYAWGEAQLVGTSVELLVRDVQGPPKDVDGGSNRYTFTFCAKAKGVTKLTIPSGGDLAQDAYTLTITVR